MCDGDSLDPGKALDHGLENIKDPEGFLNFSNFEEHHEEAFQDAGDFLAPKLPELPEQRSVEEIQAEAAAKATQTANASRRSRRRRQRGSSLSTGAGLGGGSQSSLSSGANLG